ncbi:MAG: ribonuclease HI [Nitrospiraceae bacterium]|nr:ribonuclease HI [Nitrospiraceae bacterium]
MKSTEKPFVEIYADGACSGNPGVGGYGAILRSGDKVRELSGFDQMTTNNRMELMGVISALEALKKQCKVRVTTDSTYVMKGMTEWIGTWLRNNWRNSQKKEVLNRDLWERLLKAAGPHEIEWVWIKGHNGHIENERCDLLARTEIKRCKKSSGAPAYEKA